MRKYAHKYLHHFDFLVPCVFVHVAVCWVFCALWHFLNFHGKGPDTVIVSVFAESCEAWHQIHWSMEEWPKRWPWIAGPAGRLGEDLEKTWNRHVKTHTFAILGEGQNGKAS